MSRNPSVEEHVKIWSVDEAHNPALANLIAATWEAAPESIARIPKN